jgi:hypothetical protein
MRVEALNSDGGFAMLLHSSPAGRRSKQVLGSRSSYHGSRQQWRNSKSNRDKSSSFSILEVFVPLSISLTLNVGMVSTEDVDAAIHSVELGLERTPSR